MSSKVQQLQKPSLYAQFVAECYDRKIIENDTGFITFEIIGPVCHILDVFTVKETRRTGAFYKLCKQVHEIAKESGCNKIIGWINLRCKTSTKSMKAQLAMGMTIGGSDTKSIWLERDI